MRWSTPARNMFEAWLSGPPVRTEREAAESLRAAGWPQEPGAENPSPTQQTVNRIVRGDSRPDGDKWQFFETAFGIPRIAWLTDEERGETPLPRAARRFAVPPEAA